MDFLDQIMKGMDNTKNIGSKPPVPVAAPKPKAASAPKEIQNGQTHRKYQSSKTSPNGSPSSSPPPPEPPKKKSKVVNHKRKGSASPPHKNLNNGGNKSPERTSNTRNRNKSPEATATPPLALPQASSPVSTSAPSAPTASSPTVAPITAPSPTVTKADNDDDGLPICKSAPVLVETAEQCKKAINTLRRKQCKLVAIDCEAVGMNRHGKLCLVQVASNEDCFLFDIVVGGNDLFDNGLRWLLESEDIIKVVHDCRGDSEILFYQHQVSLTNVFDTQIAFCVTCRQNAGSTPIPVSLNTLIKKYARGATNQFKDIVRTEMEACDNYWERRPMTENMIQYASQDVIYLPYIYKQFDALLSYQSKKITTAMCLRYVDQYRALPERPASPPRSQSSPSSTSTPITSTASSPTTPHQESTSPNTPSTTVSSSASPTTLEAGSPNAPSPRFVPKYGIEEWDKEISRKLESGASKFGGYSGPRRG